MDDLGQRWKERGVKAIEEEKGSSG